MTRMHFEVAARLVKAEADAGRPMAARILQNGFIDLFESFNPRFDRERFYLACGGQQ